MFIHLRVHSAYSLLEGALHLKRIVALAAEDSQPAVAVTDSASLFGALEFSEYAFGAGVQPIVGCTMPLKLAERIQGGRTISPVARLPLIAASPTEAESAVSAAAAPSGADTRPRRRLFSATL